jgi:type II secretory pathway predicted ATPase ExeA
MGEDLSYIQHFGLIAPPFQGIPDRRFIWLGDKQLEILAHLKVGIDGGKGVLLLLGDEGSGKSVLLGCLLKIVAGDIVIAILREAGISVERFFSFLAAEFKIDKEIGSKGDFLSCFKSFLLEAQSIGRKVLLVIEDAENQDNEILEQARLFSNMEEDGEKLLSVLLIGNSEFSKKLMEHRHRALMQRAAVQCRVEPFSVEETDAYIRHRMMVAGCFLRIFTLEAVEAIRRFSGGIPKAIDLICDRALMRACFEKQRAIDKKSITRYAKEARNAFGVAKVGDVGSEGAARFTEKAVSSGWNRFRKAAPLGVALAVLLLLAAGMPFLDFQEEKPPPVVAPPSPVSIYFEFASTSLAAAASSELDRVVDFLRKNPEARVTIKGYTDLKGSQKFNIRMAQSRADAAKNYLTERGVEPARVQAVGMGAEKSSDGGQRPGDPKLSRRVEIAIANNPLTAPETR